MPEPTKELPIYFHEMPFDQRLEFAVQTMREVSSQTDPQALVQTYSRRVRQLNPVDRYVGLSRRDLASPKFRVTRSDTWNHAVNPWRTPGQLPLLEGGLLAELIYGEEPRIIHDFVADPADPAYEYLQGMRSIQAMPLFDRGLSLNMAIAMRREPDGFDLERLPEQVWMSNLFGRATHNLVLSDEVKRAYDTLDKELQVVGDIQRSLLPDLLPNIPTLELAAHYQTSQRAGGDYYDFFELPDGRWGILIADVAGHGTPAAVLMAVTHSIAHTHHTDPDPPSVLMRFINRHLCARYTNGTGTFVTAFYGIYDPATRSITYSRAGHCPPRVRHANGQITPLDLAPSLPLGIQANEPYDDITHTLQPGDVIVFYTDGITESRDPTGDLFGTDRLDKVLGRCAPNAESIIRNTLLAIEDFTEDKPPTDDLTLLIAKVR